MLHCQACQADAVPALQGFYGHRPASKHKEQSDTLLSPFISPCNSVTQVRGSTHMSNRDSRRHVNRMGTYGQGPEWVRGKQGKVAILRKVTPLPFLT